MPVQGSGLSFVAKAVPGSTYPCIGLYVRSDGEGEMQEAARLEYDVAAGKVGVLVWNETDDEPAAHVKMDPDAIRRFLYLD